ncbi:Autophagy-related protein 9B, partial [Bos mutus]
EQDYERLEDGDPEGSQDSPLHGEEQQPLLHVPEGLRGSWHHIQNLDSFFTKISFLYHQRNGFTCILLEDVFQLGQFIFIATFTTFLLRCVDYNVLFANQLSNRTRPEPLHSKVTLSDAVLPSSQCAQRICSSPFLVFRLILAAAFWLFQLLRSVCNLFSYWDIQVFYREALHIPPNLRSLLLWLLVDADSYGRYVQPRACGPDDGDLEGWFYRAGRTETWLGRIGVFRPLSGGPTPLSGFSLQEATSWAPSLFLATLRSPLLLLVSLHLPLYLILSLRHSTKATFSSQLPLLPSEVQNPALQCSKGERSSESPLEGLGTDAGNVGSWTTAPPGRRLTPSLSPSFFLLFSASFQRPPSFPTPIPPSRSFIPDEQGQGRSPQLLLQAALAHMHYLPEETGPAGRTSSYRQMARLLQYRAVSLVEELLSPVLTPLFLIFWFRPRALEIIDFFRHFTVDVAGVGDICSFALMDVKRHGHPQWLSEGQTEASLSQRAEDGKTELSLMRFSLVHPQWRPPGHSSKFLGHLRGRVQQDAASCSLVPSALLPSQTSSLSSVLSPDPLSSRSQPEAFLANLLVQPLRPPQDLSPTAPCPAAATASLLASLSRITQDSRRRGTGVGGDVEGELSLGDCACLHGALCSSCVSPGGTGGQKLAQLPELASAEMSLHAIYLHQLRQQQQQQELWGEASASPLSRAWPSPPQSLSPDEEKPCWSSDVRFLEGSRSPQTPRRSLARLLALTEWAPRGSVSSHGAGGIARAVPASRQEQGRHTGELPALGWKPGFSRAGVREEPVGQDSSIQELPPPHLVHKL